MNRTLLSAAFAFLCLLLNPSARAVTITVDGTQYLVSLLVGTYNGDHAILETQPWWNDIRLAERAALDVGAAAGAPNFGGLYGPMFAHDLALNGYERVKAVVFPWGGLVGLILDPERTWTFAIATPVVEGVPDIGPSSLLLALGVGGCWLFRTRGPGRHRLPGSV